MTDDIVQRLRAKELLSVEEDGYTHFLAKNPDGDDGADEIERLRAENEALKDGVTRHAEFAKVDMDLVADLAAERNRLRDENKKLREELEMMRKACRKACKANYKLGIDKGKEKAIIRMRDMGE